MSLRSAVAAFLSMPISLTTLAYIVLSGMTRLISGKCHPYHSLIRIE